jgi:hypothetical protein
VNRAWQWLLEPAQLPLTLALAASLLTVAQMTWVTSKFIEPRTMTQLTGSNPMLDALRDEGDRVRVSVATEDPYLNTWLENQFAAMNISSLDISAASRIPGDLDRFLKNFEDNRARLYFLAGVKNIAVPEDYVVGMHKEPGLGEMMKGAEGYTVAPSMSPDVPSHALVGMKDFLEKATLVPSAEVIDSDDKLLARMKDPQWNARTSLLLTGPAPGPEFNGSKQPGTVTLDQYTPTGITAHVHAPGGGYVLINDQFDPDWSATVDGKPAPVLRADYIFRAVPVPSGDSTVQMRYVAHYRVAGLALNAEAVTLLSDGAMVAGWLVIFFALRRKPPEDRRGA